MVQQLRQGVRVLVARRGISVWLIFSAGLSVLACEGSSPPPPKVYELSRVARVTVPVPTASREIILAEEDVACIIYSYDEQIYCMARDGNAFTLGQAGDGPGEFRGLVTLLRSEDGTIAAIDRSGLRVVGLSGEFLSSVMLSGFMLDTDRMVGDGLAGTRLTPWAAWLEVVSAQTGEVLSRREFPTDVPDECAEFPLLKKGTMTVAAHVPSSAFLTPWGDVVSVCRANLALWGEEGAGMFEVLNVVSHEDEYPDEQDIADHEAAMNAVQGIAGVTQGIREYRSTPKDWWLGGHTPVFDRARDWTWIGANRDRRAFSYIDIFAGRRFEYVGSVRVHDRMVGFDLFGSTLVVLVELPLSAGASDVAVDWYDISGVAFQ